MVLCSDMDNIYRECAEMLDWVFSSFSDRQLVDTETVLTNIPLTKCRTEEAVELYAASDLSGYEMCIRDRLRNLVKRICGGERRTMDPDHSRRRWNDAAGTTAKGAAFAFFVRRTRCV